MNTHRRESLRNPQSRASQAWSAAVLLFVHAHFAHAELDAVGQSRLERLVRNLPHPKAVAGACVVELASGRAVLEYNTDVPLTPASTMKVFTMAAGLSVLGADFSFETSLATDGRNIVVIGDGDPALGDEKVCRFRGEAQNAMLSDWANRVASHLGTGAFVGELIIDESVFDSQWLHESWEAADLGKWFAAPVGGLNYNGNCVDITVRPGQRPGAPTSVSVVPQASVIQIINKSTTGSGEPILRHVPLTTEYSITGRCAKEWPFSSVSFPDPALLFGESLRAALNSRGIVVSGPIVRQRVRTPDGLPPELTILAQYETPLEFVLRRIGKDSQNMFAEALLKRTGHEWQRKRGAPNPQGSWPSGQSAVHEWLRTSGIGADGFVIADGSGLSRENRCTARQLVRVLTAVNGGPLATIFRENLSQAGVDGSLRKRLRNTPAQVFAKTGTMRGVRALAGYVVSDAGPAYAFAIIFNGYTGPSTPYKAIHDEMCQILCRACETR